MHTIAKYPHPSHTTPTVSTTNWHYPLPRDQVFCLTTSSEDYFELCGVTELGVRTFTNYGTSQQSETPFMVIQWAPLFQLNLYAKFDMVLGHTSLIKEATKFSTDLRLELSLTYPTPVCCMEEGEVVKESKIKQKLRSAQQKKLKDQVSGQAWQWKLTASR